MDLNKSRRDQTVCPAVTYMQQSNATFQDWSQICPLSSDCNRNSQQGERRGDMLSSSGLSKSNSLSENKQGNLGGWNADRRGSQGVDISWRHSLRIQDLDTTTRVLLSSRDVRGVSSERRTNRKPTAQSLEMLRI